MEPQLECAARVLIGAQTWLLLSPAAGDTCARARVHTSASARARSSATYRKYKACQHEKLAQVRDLHGLLVSPGAREQRPHPILELIAALCCWSESASRNTPCPQILLHEHHAPASSCAHARRCRLYRQFVLFLSHSALVIHSHSHFTPLQQKPQRLLIALPERSWTL